MVKFEFYSPKEALLALRNHIKIHRLGNRTTVMASDYGQLKCAVTALRCQVDHQLGKVVAGMLTQGQKLTQKEMETTELAMIDFFISLPMTETKPHPDFQVTWLDRGIRLNH